jgi:tRNA-2-methylthio-N6-dimethylallyladenosine synthase
MTSHPKDASDELIEVFGKYTGKIAPAFHLPLQSGSDDILKAMNRNYTAEAFIALVDKIRKSVPDIHIGTDFIVGFPGETDEDFNALLEVAKEVNFANIHSFVYSVRPGTPAAEMSGQIPSAISKERMKKLAVQAKLSAESFARSQRGKILPVIFEQKRNAIQYGWSDNYLAINAKEGDFPLKTIVNVRVDEKNTAENLKNPHLGDIL